MIRNSDILLYGGGECFQKFGVPFMGTNRRQRIAPTFARSGTVGPHASHSGRLIGSTTDRLRVEWEDADADLVFDTPGLLVESPAFVNLISSDDIAAWSTSGSPTITGSITDPAGGTGAYRIAGTNADYALRAITFTGDAIKSVVFVIRENSGIGAGVNLFDSSAATNRLSMFVSAWTAGKPTFTMNVGTQLGAPFYKGNGFWETVFQTTSVTAANTHEIRLLNNQLSSQSFDVYRVNVYNNTSPPWSILSASQTKATETLSRPWLHKPQAMCGHIRFRELDAPTFANQRVLEISAAVEADPRFLIYKGNAGDGYNVQHDTGGSDVIASVDINPVWGDLIDLWWWLYADGSVNIAGRRQALGSSTWSAITTGTPSVALDLATAWSGQSTGAGLINFGSVGSTGRGSQSFHRILVARGNHSTDDLSVVFA